MNASTAARWCASASTRLRRGKSGALHRLRAVRHHLRLRRAAPGQKGSRGAPLVPASEMENYVPIALSGGMPDPLEQARQRKRRETIFLPSVWVGQPPAQPDDHQLYIVRRCGLFRVQLQEFLRQGLQVVALGPDDQKSGGADCGRLRPGTPSRNCSKKRQSCSW